MKHRLLKFEEKINMFKKVLKSTSGDVNFDINFEGCVPEYFLRE